MYLAKLHITTAYHSVRLAIAAIALSLSLPLTMHSETMDSLYTIYMSSPSHNRTATANKILAELHRQAFIDTLIRFNSSDKATDVEVRTHYQMSEYFFASGDYEAAKDAGEHAREKLDAVKDDRLKSDILGLSANIYFRIGSYDKALEMIHAAYQIDMRLKDDELISSDLNTIAAIFLGIQRPEPGIRYIEKAIALERKLNRPDRLAIRLGLCCELHLMNNQPEKAMDAIREAYDIDLSAGRNEKAAIRLSQMSDVYNALSQLDKAWDAAAQALSTLEKTQNVYSTAVCYNQLGELSLKKSDFSSAQYYFKRALEQGIKSGAAKVESDAERGLWQALRDTNPAVALLHLERHTALNDSMQSRILSAQMGVMDITAQSIEQNERINSDKRNRTTLLIVKWLLALMALLTVGGLFYAWRRSKRALQLQQQAQDMRSHFTDNITHALQNPLTVIIEASQQLRDGTKNSSTLNRRIGEIIYNHGNNMLGLVNQLLDIESTRTDDKITQPRLTAGDIVMFVRLLVNSLAESAHRQLITLEFISPVSSLNVMFAVEHFRKIISTLIINALKFTPSNGSIIVQLNIPDKSHITLQVSDTGKGIPAKEIGRVFEPFSQADINYEGLDTAVDLTLVQQLVKSIDGEIRVDSTPGEGTTFTIHVPVTPVDGPDNGETTLHNAESRIRQKRSTSKKPLVFIVENNDDVAFLIANHLKDDYELRFASEGQEALHNALELVPDLVITNITLPVMDGKELIKQLRHESSLCHIPIIAMMSAPNETERIDCIRSGADAVLIKPFNSSELELLAKHMTTQRTLLRKQLAQTHNDLPTPSMSKEDMEFTNRLVEIIHAQMAKGEIDMERIATALSISRKQLRQQTLDITGLTPVAFVLQVRLKRASRMLLSDQETPLSTIASKCGFQTASHFSKSFKQMYGVSPLQYRKHGNDLNAIDHPY